MATPVTDPEKLREAAHWFDLFDELTSLITVEEKATQAKYLLSELTSGTEIQDSLRQIADRIERMEKALRQLETWYFKSKGWL